MKKSLIRFVAICLLSIVCFDSSVAQSYTDSISSAKGDSLSNLTNDEYLAYMDSVFRSMFSDPVKVTAEMSRNTEENTFRNSLTEENTHVPNTVNIDQTKAVGEIPIESGMSPSGAKTYNVPINLYHVEGKPCPQLSLSYNSQQGNGVMGIGWSVSGLQVITHGNKSVYYDNEADGVHFDAEDAFFLNGTRLILTNSSSTEKHYETETGHIKVVGYCSASVMKYFVAYYPNGSQGVFGYESNTENKATYPVTTLTDCKGNNIYYGYTSSSNIYHISYITYKPSCIITFEYENNRPDIITNYHYGREFMEVTRLKKINCYHNDILQNTYTLSYTQQSNVSVLTQIGYTSDGVSLNPLRFYYGTGATDGFNTASATFSSGYDFSSDAEIIAIRGRFNYSSSDDGIVCYPHYTPYSYVNNTHIKTFRNVYDDPSSLSDIYLYTDLSSSYIPSMSGLTTGSGFIQMLCADLTGNQEEYPIKINNTLSGTNDNVKFTVYKKGTDGTHSQSYTRTFTFQTVYSDGYGNNSIQPKDYFVGDFNGDGKSEILAISANNPFGETTRPSKCYIFDLENNELLMNDFVLTYIKGFVNSPSSLVSDIIEAFDYDGDGKTDLCHINGNGVKFYTFRDSENGIVCNYSNTIYRGLTKESLRYCRCLFGDFNGDGLVDILVSPSSLSNQTSWNAYFNRGNGNFWTSTLAGPTNTSDKKFLVQDIDNDGTSDLVCQEGSTLTFYRIRNGENVDARLCNLPYANMFLAPISLSASTTSNVLIGFKGTNVKKLSYKKNERSELLATGMANSLGVVQKNYYHVISQDSWQGVYTKGSDAVFPYINMMEPIAVLAKDEQYVNSTMVDRNLYFYTNAVFHRQGLGFCGFGKLRTSNFKGQSSLTIYNPYQFGNMVSSSSPYRNTSYTYNSSVQNNKIRRNTVACTIDTDVLKGVTWTTNYTYNNYDYPVRIVSSSGNYQVTKVIGYKILTDTSQHYQLDLVKNESETTILGNTSYTTSMIYSGWDSHYLPTVITKKTNGLVTEQISRTYNSYGLLASESVSRYGSANVLTTTRTYSGFRLASLTDPIGNSTSYSYDSFGRVASKNDNTGTTSYTYDGLGRIISEQMPDGTANTVTYGWNSSLTGACYSITATSSVKPTETTVYDARNRVIRTSKKGYNGSFVHTDMIYDNYGRLQRMSTPFISSASAWNSYMYDIFDRTIQSSEVGRGPVNYSYLNNTISEDNGQNFIKKYYDAKGHLTKVEDDAGVTTYSLHANGNPLSVNVQGNTVTFEYDSYGRRIKMTDPSHGMTTYEYDAEGNLSKITDANGNITQMNYDSYGRLTSKVNTEFTSSYSYNNTYNKLSAVTSTNGTSRTFTFDAYGRMTVKKENSVDGKWFQQSLSYDNAGNVSSVSYSSNRGTLGTESYIYTNQNLCEVKWNGSSIFKLTGLNSQGMASAVTTGPVNRSYGYSASCQPVSRIITCGSSVLMNMVYTYNGTTANLTGRTNNLAGLSESFTYDELSRLTQYGGINVEYDSSGNITEKGDVGSFAYNSTSKPYAVTDVTLSNNNLTLGTQTVSYTSFNRPNTISDNGYSASFTYNSEYDRVRTVMKQGSQTVLTRYYMGGCYEADVLPNGTVTERLYLNGDYYSGTSVLVKQNSSSLYYIGRDHLGSITHVINSNGTVIQELSYDAWGRLRNPQTNEVYAIGSEPTLFLGRGYCGHEHLTEMGLINMNARLYDPLLGRFLSPDPFVQLPDLAQNYNRYSYCLNNPLMYVDKDGESILGVIGILAAVFAVGNTTAHAIKGDINNFGDGFRYFAQGALAGAAIGAVWEAVPFIPVIGNAVQTGMTYYVYAQGAVSGLGLVGGAVKSGWHGIGRSLQLTFGNFYLDENINVINGALKGLSRHTYEFLQTFIGHSYSQLNNSLGLTTRVDYLGGATFSSFENNHKSRGISIGNYINIWNHNNITGDFVSYVKSHPLYMHEYGHTIDSRIWGPLYIPVIGIHSISDLEDDNCWTEIRANRFAKYYFGKYFQVDWSSTYDDDKGNNISIEQNFHTYKHIY